MRVVLTIDEPKENKLKNYRWSSIVLLSSMIFHKRKSTKSNRKTKSLLKQQKKRKERLLSRKIKKLTKTNGWLTHNKK